MGDERSNRHYAWYRGTAVHLFRVYFRYVNEGRKPETKAKQKTHFLCESVLNNIPEKNRYFLSKYFSCKWGEDQQFVKDYSVRSGIGETILWRIIEDANRKLFELTGLLEPKKSKPTENQ